MPLAQAAIAGHAEVARLLQQSQAQSTFRQAERRSS